MCGYKVGQEVSVWWGGINATIKKIIDDKILVMRMNDGGDLVWGIIKNEHEILFCYDDEEFNTKDLK